MFGSGIIATIGDDLAWVQNNAFLVFGIALFLVIIIIFGFVLVKM